MSDDLRLSSLTHNLKIPSNFLRLEHITDTATLTDLDRWKRGATLVLQEILHLVKIKENESLPVDLQSDIIFAVLPFASNNVLNKSGTLQEWYGNGSWIAPDSQYAAEAIISSPVFSPSQTLISQVLGQKLKPIFKLSPHPNLHAETGRKVTIRPGGPLAVHDYYEEQKWKEYPGIEKIVLWCVSELQENAYQTLWHLLIPPIMTLLDDYEARNKLHGVVIVQQMLLRVPRELLLRTGVDGLLRQSLRTSLSHIQSPETPQLLKRAIDASVRLILLTTTTSPGTKPSPKRFNELSSLLGEGIISGIWLYAEDKPDAVDATFEALPFLLQELGIGSIRFMKPLIPQLTHTLIPRPLVEPDTRMQLSAICVLDTLLDVCQPRIEPWKETILNAIGRCWVGLIDEERGITNSGIQRPKDSSEVKKGLKMLCIKLAEICPSVIQNEFQRFLQADKALFEDLLLQQVIVAA